MNHSAAVRRAVTAAGLAVLLAGVAGMARAGAESGTAGEYSVFARADVSSVSVVVTGAPVVPGGEVAYASPASSQAAIDSLGTSKAFSSAPYPGEVLATLPGTIRGASNGSLPVPDYPLYVTSDYPSTPRAERHVGVNSLSARSDPAASAGQATVALASGGPDIASGVGRATAERDSAGTFVADATATVSAFAVSPAVRIGDIIAHVRLRAVPGQPVLRETSFSVASVTVNGQRFGFTDKGLVAGDQTLLPAGAAAATSALAAAGIELAYVPGAQTDTSVTSAALRISYTTKTVQGPTQVTAVLGQVSARAAATRLPTLDDEGGSMIGDAGPVGPSDPAPTDGPVTATPPPAGDVNSPAPLPAGTADLASPVVVAPSPPAAPPTAVLDGAAAAPAQSIGMDIGPSGRTFYLALIVSGALAVIAARLLALFGVRHPSR